MKRRIRLEREARRGVIDWPSKLSFPRDDKREIISWTLKFDSARPTTRRRFSISCWFKWLSLSESNRWKVWRNCWSLYCPVMIGASNSQNCSKVKRRTSTTNTHTHSSPSHSLSSLYLADDHCSVRRCLCWSPDGNVCCAASRMMPVDACDSDDRPAQTIRTSLSERRNRFGRERVSALGFTFDHFSIHTFGVLSVFFHDIITDFVVDHLHDLPILGLMGYSKRRSQR